MRARRRFAQHFLEAAWVRKLVDALALAPEDVVLEIGPGRGALTRALAARAAAVTAVEIDRDLAAELAREAPSHVRVVEADILAVDLASLLAALQGVAPPGGRVRIVGNLPYNISSPILVRIVDAFARGAPVVDAAVMLQREVADRVAAQPGTGDWGPLGIMVQRRADVTRLLALPPGAFRPPPQVHSAVLRLHFRPPLVSVPDEGVFDTLVRTIFGRRRKTLQNALRPLAAPRGLDAGALLREAELDPRRRPETLDLAELSRLASVFTAQAAGATAAPVREVDA